jgi:hypothetical protein
MCEALGLIPAPKKQKTKRQKKPKTNRQVHICRTVKGYTSWKQNLAIFATFYADAPLPMELHPNKSK